jgi:hypothetical protein
VPPAGAGQRKAKVLEQPSRWRSPPLTIVVVAPNFHQLVRRVNRQLLTGVPAAPPPLRMFPGDGLQTAYVPMPLCSLNLNQFFLFPRVVNTYFFVNNQPVQTTVLP